MEVIPGRVDAVIPTRRSPERVAQLSSSAARAVARREAQERRDGPGGLMNRLSPARAFAVLTTLEAQTRRARSLQPR